MLLVLRKFHVYLGDCGELDAFRYCFATLYKRLIKVSARLRRFSCFYLLRRLWLSSCVSLLNRHEMSCAGQCGIVQVGCKWVGGVYTSITLNYCEVCDVLQCIPLFESEHILST